MSLKTSAFLQGQHNSFWTSRISSSWWSVVHQELRGMPEGPISACGNQRAAVHCEILPHLPLRTDTSFSSRAGCPGGDWWGWTDSQDGGGALGSSAANFGAGKHWTTVWAWCCGHHCLVSLTRSLMLSEKAALPTDRMGSFLFRRVLGIAGKLSGQAEAIGYQNGT